MTPVLPAGACDAHCHVFGPQTDFAYAPQRTYTPADAPKEALYALHRRLGFDRAVLVQPAAYGSDHRALLDALTHAPGDYRGVALLPEDVTAEAIGELHAAGVRGARFNFVPHLGKPPSRRSMWRIADLVGPLGWHLALHLTGEDLAWIDAYLAGLQTPFVVDHMARVSAADGGVEQPAFELLLRTLEHEAAWVKISGADRLSAAGAPFDDAAPFLRALAAARPDRLLWGTDWPHPNIRGPIPDETELLALLWRAIPKAAVREAVLVDNPARLFGFVSADVHQPAVSQGRTP